MDYIIVNFHKKNCNNLEKKIKNAVNPFYVNMGLDGPIYCNTDFYFNKFKHIINDRSFFLRINTINLSKYLNSKILIFQTKSNDKQTRYHKMKEYDNKSKIIKYKFEVIETLGPNTIRYFEEYLWDDDIKMYNVLKIKCINRDYKFAVEKRYLKNSLPE